MWEKLQEKEYCAILVPDAGSNDSQYAIKLNVPILVLDHHILEDDYLANNLILINNQVSEKYVNIKISITGNGIDYFYNKEYDDSVDKTISIRKQNNEIINTYVKIYRQKIWGFL